MKKTSKSVYTADGADLVVEIGDEPRSPVVTVQITEQGGVRSAFSYAQGQHLLKALQAHYNGDVAKLESVR